MTRGRFDVFPMDRGPYPDQANTVGGWLITSYFGGRIDPITGHPGNHGGQDMAYSGCRGARFYAPKPCRVSQGWDPGGGGNWTSMFCDDGDYVGIGHALSFAPGVNGTHVEAGTLLGYVDSTGSSTGDHVHLALNVGSSGGYDDPFDALAEAARAGRYPGAITNDPGQAPQPGPDPAPPAHQEDDDVASLEWNDNAKQLWLAAGNTKRYIPAVSKDGVDAEEFKRQAIARGVVDNTGKPGGAEYLSGLSDISDPAVSPT